MIKNNNLKSKNNNLKSKSNNLKSKRSVVAVLACIFYISGMSQTFSNTHSGTLGNSMAPSGWTKKASPELSTTTQNYYDNSSWASTLPISPSGSTKFPVVRSANPLEALWQTITNLTIGNVYPITVKYMYPSGSGTYSARFQKPSVNSAYVKIGGDTTFLPGGSGVSENIWYSTTINYTATSTSVSIELGMDGKCVDLAATAFDFGSNAVLPVDLIHFDVNAVANHHTDLYWSTASEINNSHFEIERSYDGRNFEAIGEVAGNGNSQHRIDYSYTDASVSKLENTVFYRLKQVDFDGAFEYSDIRVVRFDDVGNKLQLVAYPNPMNDKLNVMLSLSSGEKYQLQVINSKGALVYQKNHLFSNGLHNLDLSQWNEGMYTLKVTSNQGTRHIKVMKK